MGTLGVVVMENMVVSKFGDQKHYWWSSAVEASSKEDKPCHIDTVILLSEK
jgi:hypothetical protein